MLMFEEVSTKETKEASKESSSKETPKEPVQESLPKEAPEELEKFDSAIKKLSTNNKTVLKSSVKTLLSTLQNLQKKPTDPKNRKLRMENIVIKKFISGARGAQEFLEIVGFRVTEVSSKKFFEIEQESINQDLLTNAIELLTDKLKHIESGDQFSTAGTTSPPAVPKQKFCLGKCGFFGDEKTEGMCSLCYRKKYGNETKSTLLCSKGCGLYGLTKYKGMCSICYGKETQTKSKDLKRRWRLALTKIKVIRRFYSNLKPKQTNTKRCWKCKRKIGITGIECRCGYIFCGKDRYASEHDCPYNFKEAHQKKLVKENLKLTGKKMDKIDSD